MTITLLLWLHQTNDYDGICYFSCYIKPMTMTVFVTSLVTSNKWLWRYFSGYIKPMTMTVFVASLVTSIKPMTMMVFVASLVTSNQWLWRYFSGYIKPMTMTLLLWLHQTNDYDVTSLVTSNQWLWRYFSGNINQRNNIYRHSHWFDVTREVTS
jgi:hypothetical protein